MTRAGGPLPPAPRALVVAPLRGPAAGRLGTLADVIYDPWLNLSPVRLYQPEELAARIRAEQATILITEADQVSGPVFDHQLTVVAVTRGDPVNVDVPMATRRGIPVLYTPGRNADAVAELAVGLLFAPPSVSCWPTARCGRAPSMTAGNCRRCGTGHGSWPARPPGWWASAR